VPTKPKPQATSNTIVAQSTKGMDSEPSQVVHEQQLLPSKSNEQRRVELKKFKGRACRDREIIIRSGHCHASIRSKHSTRNFKKTNEQKRQRMEPEPTRQRDPSMRSREGEIHRGTRRAGEQILKLDGGRERERKLSFTSSSRRRNE
jgi:hypothetical protein